jgi:hypothetical protein
VTTQDLEFVEHELLVRTVVAGALATNVYNVADVREPSGHRRRYGT